MLSYLHYWFIHINNNTINKNNLLLEKFYVNYDTWVCIGIAVGAVEYVTKLNLMLLRVNRVFVASKQLITVIL